MTVRLCAVVGWLERDSLVVGVKRSCWLSACRCRLAGVVVLWPWCVESQVSLLSEGGLVVSVLVL